MNRSVALFLNVLIIAGFAGIFFGVENPWGRLASTIGFAVIVRVFTLNYFLSLTSESQSAKVPVILFNLIGGIVFCAVVTGAFFAIGHYFPATRSILKLVISFLMVIIAFKSTFPLDMPTDGDRQIRS